MKKNTTISNLTKTPSESSLQSVDFSFIRYANCWEDADVLLEGLNLGPGSKILSICSAGDNSLSLLSTSPEKVVAVDINFTQLHLAELKKCCFIQLEYSEMLELLGFASSNRRKLLFNKLKGELSTEALQYWDMHFKIIEKGLIHQGKFEKYFRIFRKFILPMVHSKNTVKEFLKEKTEQEQQEFYHKKWNNWRYRLMFRIFFSKMVMGKYGRDPKFLNEVKLPVHEYIFRKSERHLLKRGMYQNYFLRYILTGSFGNTLPHYVRPENFSIIKENINKLEIWYGLAEEHAAAEKFSHFNLSNIFEYLDDATFANAAYKIVVLSPAGTKLLYWNLMVPRKISTILPEKLNFIQDLSDELTANDKGFFYNQVIVEEIKP